MDDPPPIVDDPIAEQLLLSENPPALDVEALSAIEVSASPLSLN